MFSVYENCIYHFMAEGVLLNSAHANGGPRSWVRTCKTLCSAPINVSGNFPASVSAESCKSISPNCYSWLRAIFQLMRRHVFCHQPMREGEWGRAKGVCLIVDFEVGGLILESTISKSTDSTYQKDYESG